MNPFQLIAAPFTPFDSSGALQLPTIEKQAAHLQKNAVNGAFVCGTTGESASLSIEERKQVAQRWRETSDLRILVHVGHTNLNQARELAAHSGEIGADGIAATAPFYFKTPDAVSTAHWCAQIAEVAPQLPFFYYHIPSLTGVHFPVAPFLSVAREQISNFGGVKFTHEDVFDFGRCLDLGEDLELFFGRDENLLAGLALGARSAVGSTYNFAAPLFRRIIEAFERGDLETARTEQKKVREFIAVMIRFGGLAAGKTMMKLCGVDCGPCRAPLATLSAQHEADLQKALDEIGFFAWI